MIKHTFSVAIIAVALCIAPYSAIAGSTRPNPKALAETATSQLTSQNEIQGFFAKLARGGEYTKKFDAAAFANDKTMLVALIREAGVKTGEVSIGQIAPDKKITITITTKRGTTTITIEW